MPSSFGILTSSSARSGSSVRASVTASSPSLASAQTSKPAFSSSSRRSSLMIVSSSAIRIRIVLSSRSRREPDFGAQAVVVHERQLTAELVADERSNDGEAGAVGCGLHAVAVVGDRKHDFTVVPRQPNRDLLTSVLESVSEELAEDERERGRPLPLEPHGLEAGGDVLADLEALHEHRPQPVDQLVQLDVVLAKLGQHLVDGRDREDPVDGVTECLLRIDVGGARLQAEQ